ncbi:MAG: primosomal protein N' [bacterium]
MNPYEPNFVPDVSKTTKKEYVPRSLPDCVDVALPAGVFTYEVPEQLRSVIKIGMLVEIPFNNKKTCGWVVGIKEKKELSHIKNIKELLRLCSPESLISVELMELAKWMCTYYQSNVGAVLNLMVPPFTESMPIFSSETKPKLNLSKEKAPFIINEALEAKKFKVVLLQGLNREAIYIKTINEALSYNRDVIFLVPGIDLTAKVGVSLEEQFGKTVAFLHSGLKKKERWLEWSRIKKGDAKIVVGTMSAVFAPVNKLGVIILDEENNLRSYKSDKHPHYSAQTVSVMRAKIESCLYVAGSTMPSVEAFYNTEQKKSALFKLTSINRTPRVSIVDMREEADRLLSQKLKAGLKRYVDNKERILLFLNRKGFSSFVMCEDCGYIPECPKCSIPLTYYKADADSTRSHFLKCHYCGYAMEAIGYCPKCKGIHLTRKGIGTTQVERRLKNLFPGVNVFRLDSDNVSGGYITHIFKAFETGKIQVLIGTQLIAKPSELPDIGLFGLISADTFLNFPDFRAPERAYLMFGELIMKSKEAIIQTYNPGHRVLQHLRSSNYAGFYNEEKNIRKELNYPPYSHLIKITVEGQKDDILQSKAELIANKLTELNLNFIGPSFAAETKTRKASFLIKISNPATISLTEKLPTGVKIDIDPIEFTV